MLSDQLAHWGWMVTETGAAAEGRALLSPLEDIPSCVLLDAQLGEDDGLELVRWMRSDPSRDHVPVVFMSTFGDRARRQAVRGFGGVYLLSKPVRYRTLGTLFARLFPAQEGDRVHTRDLNDAAGEADNESAGSGANALAGRRILLAEDNPVNQKVAVRMLERLGLVVDVVGDGKLAVDAALTTRYDLIFMDHQMPEMDGVEASIRIRANEDSRNPVPIVALTAHALADVRRECYSAGMSDFLAKPIRQVQLREMVQRWVLHREAGEQERGAA
jgi:CheY-like chemotaxis protein